MDRIFYFGTTNNQKMGNTPIQEVQSRKKEKLPLDMSLATWSGTETLRPPNAAVGPVQTAEIRPETTSGLLKLIPEKDYYKGVDKIEYADDIEKINKDVIDIFTELDNKIHSNSITVRDIKEAIKNYQTFFNGLDKKSKLIYLGEMNRFVYQTYIKQSTNIRWTDPHLQGLKKYALYIAMEKFIYENS